MLMLLLIPANNHPIQMISVKLLRRDRDTVCANILRAVYNYCDHQEGMKVESVVARPLMFQPVCPQTPTVCILYNTSLPTGKNAKSWSIID